MPSLPANLSETLYRLSMAIWLGAMCAIGYLAAPTLFANLLDNKILAGNLAGAMFSRLYWLGLVCALVLIATLWQRHRMQLASNVVFRLCVAMLVLSSISHLGLQPWMAELKAQALPLPVGESAHAKTFGMLHGISSVLFLLQTLCGIAMVHWQSRAWLNNTQA